MDTIRLFDANGEVIPNSPSREFTVSPIVQRLIEECAPIAYVSGAGHYLPSQIVTNRVLATYYRLRFPDHQDDSPEQFDLDVFRRTGILARRHALAELTLSELAVQASMNAMTNAGITISDVSHIVIGSTYFGMPRDGFAQQIRDGLGSSTLQVELLEYACASAGYCIHRAVELLENDSDAQHVLVVGADKGSSFINFEDPNTAILFGDGAGALVISRRPMDSEMSSAIFATSTCELPEYADYIYMNEHGKVEMPNGTGVFKQACTAVKQTVLDLLAERHLQASDLDLFVLHQANMRLPAYVAKSFGLDPGKVPTNIQNCGNTCAASPLILASEASQSGLLQRGALSIIGAVGLGMRASGVLLSW